MTEYEYLMQKRATMRGGLGGAALGSLLGAGAGYLTGDDEDEAKGQKGTRLRNALIGALLGGGAGGAGGALLDKKYGNKIDVLANRLLSRLKGQEVLDYVPSDEVATPARTAPVTGKPTGVTQAPVVADNVAPFVPAVDTAVEPINEVEVAIPEEGERLVPQYAKGLEHLYQRKLRAQQG